MVRLNGVEFSLPGMDAGRVESHRDSGTQPRVARKALPWVNASNFQQPCKRLCLFMLDIRQIVRPGRRCDLDEIPAFYHQLPFNPQNPFHHRHPHPLLFQSQGIPKPVLLQVLVKALFGLGEVGELAGCGFGFLSPEVSVGEEGLFVH